ncbi:MAG: DUF1003 domain-containing protein [Ginsengibacter sp.]
MSRKKRFNGSEKDLLNHKNNESDKQNSPEKSATTPDVRVKKNIESIMSLEEKNVHSRSTAEHIADKVTTFAGSAPFIILHLIWFGVWILLNVGLIPGVAPFDPFPFSFLTLVVSLEAIFLTLLVLMSQNRMTKEADKRAHLDLQINMLAEQEGTMTLRMIQRIGKHLGLGEEIVEAAHELSEETDVNQVAKTLEEKSPD